MKMNQDLRNYDELECPHCEEMCKPTSVNKKGTVSYKHNCTQGDGYSFKIDVDGELVE